MRSIFVQNVSVRFEMPLRPAKRSMG